MGFSLKKKDITITNTFQEILDESNREMGWVDKESEFYNRSMESWLQDKRQKPMQNKYFVAERVMRTLNNKKNLQRYDFSINKSVY